MSVNEEEFKPIVGKIPHGNIINMIMSRGQSPLTYYALTDWVLQVLGYGDSQSLMDGWEGDDDFNEETITDLKQRIENINDVNLLLTIIEMAEAGIRGCSGDRYNDAVCKVIVDICLTRLQNFDLLPPSIWHKVHRHALWQRSAETEAFVLPSPDGWVSFKGVRPECHGAWYVSMKSSAIDTTLDGWQESPQYVTGLGLKAKSQNQYAKLHNGVECKAFHLFNADGTLWGFEVYLISPKKTVGCEVTKDGRFSLFRADVYLPPRQNDIRQGDVLFRRIDIKKDDIVSEESRTYLPKGVDNVYFQEEGEMVVKDLVVAAREHKHKEYNYWHPISRLHIHEDPSVPENRAVRGTPEKYDNVLILSEDAVIMHPDHPSVALKSGYWQILPVEGETDFQPPQRRGD
jgi:hypothetical protein